MVKVIPRFDFRNAERVLHTVLRNTDEDLITMNYMDYWKSLIPDTREDEFRRLLFAFLSIHTTWQNNIRAYQMLSKLDWLGDRERLRKLLIATSAGLHNVRTDRIYKAAEQWFSGGLNRRGSESLRNYRERLVTSLFGIGMAKVSFFIEMLNPFQTQVVCLDVHQLKLYGIENKVPSPEQYRIIEAHWCGSCLRRKIPPYVARSIYWDTLKNELSTHYWSYVLKDFKPQYEFYTEELVGNSVRKELAERLKG